MSGFGKIYESSNWGVGVCDNTIGWGSSYKSIANCSDASFSYSSDSYAQDGSNPTPTITGDAGGTFTATPSGLTINSSTGEITLSSSSVNSYTVKYELSDGTFTEQSLAITAASFANVNSFSFDGVDEQFESNSLTFLNGAANASFSFWLNSNDVGSSVNGFFQQYGTGGNTIYAWIRPSSNQLDIFQSGSVKYRVTGASSPFSSINFGDWFNLIIVVDGTLSGSNKLKVYLNGSLITTGISFSAGVSALTTSTEPFLIGRSAGYGQFWDGKIDEVAVWNSSLSSAAVTEIYNSGAPNDLDSLSSASSPSCWWRMGEEASFSNPGGSGNWTMVNQGTQSLNATSENMEEADKTTDVPT